MISTAGSSFSRSGPARAPKRARSLRSPTRPRSLRRSVTWRNPSPSRRRPSRSGSSSSESRFRRFSSSKRSSLSRRSTIGGCSGSSTFCPTASRRTSRRSSPRAWARPRCGSCWRASTLTSSAASCGMRSPIPPQAPDALGRSSASPLPMASGAPGRGRSG